MKISGIYQIQSKVKPERIYIGSALNIQRRWGEHLRGLKRGNHVNGKLQNHYNKYGKNDLVFSILIGCAKDDLIDTEQFYLDSKKYWFNLSPTAGSTKGLKVSREKKSCQTSWNKGKKLSEEHKQNIGKGQIGENNSFFGKSHSKESNDNRRQWNIDHNIKPPTYHGGRPKRAKNRPKFEPINPN